MSVTEEVMLRCNRMLQLLDEAKKRPTRPELVLASGWSPEEVASTIFELKRKGCLCIHDDSTYELTTYGKNSVPPKFVKDLSKYKPEAGYKHIHGVNGKFDYSKPLRGGLASLYNALTHPMCARDWYNAANMEMSAASAYAGKLKDLGIVKYDETKKVYERAIAMTIKDEEPPKPRLTPALPGDPIVEKIVEQNAPFKLIVSNFSKPNPTLADAIDELVGQYTPMEIMIECLVRFESEWKELLDFKTSVLQTTRVETKK